MAKKIYLAGPMTGYKHFNFVKFDTESYKLRKQGWDVFSPADNDRELLGKPKDWVPQLSDTDTSDEDYIRTGNRTVWGRWSNEHKLDLRTMMGHDLAYICAEADAIAMLPGWERSRGAMTEHALAVCLGLEIKYVG